MVYVIVTSLVWATAVSTISAVYLFIKSRELRSECIELREALTETVAENSRHRSHALSNVTIDKNAWVKKEKEDAV